MWRCSSELKGEVLRNCADVFQCCRIVTEIHADDKGSATRSPFSGIFFVRDLIQGFFPF